MAIKNKKEFRRIRIKYRIRKDVKGTPDRMRLSVYRSNKQIYAQIVDDLNGKTVIASSSAIPAINESKVTKCEKAKLVGKNLAERALEAGITTVVFDRNGYLYHGRVKSLAEGAREGGLIF